LLKIFRERFAEFFNRLSGPPPLNEDSTLHEIAAQYNQLYDFIERKYGVKADADDRILPLRSFVEKYGLPPGQIVFMEAQMSGRNRTLRELTAEAASKLIHTDPRVRVLDVREEWEGNFGHLPRSQALKPALLDEILQEWPRETPILLYCHYGIRSHDAASFLADRGFSQVHTLRGGIEAWSRDVDPTLPHYESAYC
jgi:rhodanese-related sulfurtransferase